jgi:hypothetical protein
MKCEKCENELEIRPHRRTKLCETCYYEKRKNDVLRNVHKIRNVPDRKMKKFDIEFRENLQKIFDKGYDILEFSRSKHYIKFDGIINFIKLPSGVADYWFVRYEGNTTKLIFKIAIQYLPLINVDLNNWIRNLSDYTL